MDDSALLRELTTRGVAGAADTVESATTDFLGMIPDLNSQWKSWPADRQKLAAKQYICALYFKENGVDVAVGTIDGLSGPNTRNAFDTYNRMSEGGVAYTRPNPVTPAPVVSSPTGYVINYAARKLLPFQSQMIAYYGQPGTNQVEMKLPYPFRLDWDPTTIVTKMTCHKLAVDDYSQIFETTLSHYGLDGIRQLGIDMWGGTLNIRKMRGGTSWSMHAWGCASDFLTATNDLRTPWKKAAFSKPEYVAFVNAWLSLGWVSLGLEHNFDAMHFQRAQVN